MLKEVKGPAGIGEGRSGGGQSGAASVGKGLGPPTKDAFGGSPNSSFDTASVKTPNGGAGGGLNIKGPLSSKSSIVSSSGVGTKISVKGSLENKQPGVGSPGASRLPTGGSISGDSVR